MNELLHAALSEFLPTLGGGIATGMIWLIKSVYQARRDLDCAHQKIRALEEKFKPLE